MKKFIANVTSYLLIISLLTVSINEIYKKLDNSNSDYTKKFNDVPDNIEICNFGSSHGLYGYDYEDIEDEYTCFNFALSSQMLSYDYRIMKYYQGYMKKGCIVFINVSYFSLIGKGEVNDAGFESKNKRYYKILPKEYIKEYDTSTDFYVKEMPALDAGIDLIKAVFGKLVDETYYVWEQTADDIDLDADTEAAYLSHLVTNKLDENGKLIVNQEEIDALYDMIDLCYENEWIPIIITTPFLEEFYSKAYERSPEFIDWFNDTMNDITTEIGACYYDYSTDTRFANNHDLFTNGDHLNREGARQFVDILYDEVIIQYME